MSGHVWLVVEGGILVFTTIVVVLGGAMLAVKLLGLLWEFLFD